MSYGFTSPASSTLLGLHVRIEPPRRDKGSPDYQLVTLQSDANGQPSGEILAGTEIATPAGEDPWHYAALDAVEVLQGTVYHVVIEPSDGGPSRSRVCFLAHRDDPPDTSSPWTALVRGPQGWASLDARRQWVEPVFLLELGDGTVWGQPYVGVRTEGVFGANQLTAQFVGVGGTMIDSVDARLRARGGGGVLAYDVVDESGMVLRSGAFQPRAAARPWVNGYTAQFLPLVLDAGRVYSLIVAAPYVDASSRFVHRTPFTDFPGHTLAQGGRGLKNTSQAADARQHEMPKRTISAAFRAISTTCGNDQLDAGEMCDGALDDACPGRCRSDCTCGDPAPAVCGDGVRNENEVCDGADDQLCAGSCRSDCSCPVPGLPVNVALQATARASSEDRPARPRHAVDGVVGGAPANPEYEWSARHQGSGAWLSLSWASPVWTDRVVLHDRPSLADNIRAARLHFDDGTEIAVDTLPTDGAPHTVTFPRRVVSRITLLIDAVDGVAGLAEMQVLAAEAQPPIPTATPVLTVTRTPTMTPTRTVTQTPSAFATSAGTPPGGGTTTPSPQSTASPAAPCVGTYYVASSGSDANDGRVATRPFKTIQRAANAAQAGDVVCVAAGVYRQRIILPRSGTAAQPIVFAGDPGAIVDGGDAQGGLSGVWSEAPEVGPGVYKRSFGYSRTRDPESGVWNGKYLLRIADSRMDDGSFAGILRNGPTLSREGCCVSTNQITSWDGVEGLFGVSAAGVTYIRFRNGQHPETQDLRFAPKGVGAFHLDGRSGVTIRGFEIRNSHCGVSIVGGSDNVVQNCSFRAHRSGVFVTGPSSRNVVRGNSFTLGYLYSLSPDDPLHWAVWKAFRQVSENPRHAVWLYGVSGEGNQVVENFASEVFDGFAVGGRHTLLARNTVINAANDGLNNGGDNSDTSGLMIRDNRVTHANVCLRIEGGIPTSESSYYFRNKCFTRDDGLTPTGKPIAEHSGIYFMRGTANQIRIYHNSISSEQGLVFGSTTVTIGAPNTKIVNNVFSSKRGYALYSSGWDAVSTPKPEISKNWWGSRSGGGIGTRSWWGSNVLQSGRAIWPANVDPETVTSPGYALPVAGACPTAAGCDAKTAGYDLRVSLPLIASPYEGASEVAPLPGPLPDLGVVERGD